MINMGSAFLRLTGTAGAEVFGPPRARVTFRVNSACKIKLAIRYSSWHIPWDPLPNKEATSMAGMHAIDQRKTDLVPLLQQGLNDLSSGLRIEPDLVGQGWRWTIVDPATSDVLESFTLAPERVANLKRLDEYTRSALKNALMRISVRQGEEAAG
jgi:hypothetical protein